MGWSAHGHSCKQAGMMLTLAALPCPQQSSHQYMRHASKLNPCMGFNGPAATSGRSPYAGGSTSKRAAALALFQTLAGSCLANVGRILPGKR